MRPNNNKIANMNSYELFPAKDVKTHLREVITPRKSNVQETTHPLMENDIKPPRKS